jgi:hypothetical protein
LAKAKQTYFERESVVLHLFFQVVVTKIKLSNKYVQAIHQVITRNAIITISSHADEIRAVTVAKHFTKTLRIL